MASSQFELRKTSVRIFVAFCLFIILTGCVMRLWHIDRHEFIHYDEGLYLNYNRALGELIDANYPLTTQDLLRAFRIYLRTSLASGKVLWHLVSDLRIFFGKVDALYIPRIISAVFGVLSLFLVYCFASRFFRSKRIAWLSAALLAVLPSHVFYSRLGMQETMCTCLLLIAFYFYFFPRKFSWKSIVAGVFFGLAFFSNYRLIILPALIGVGEIWLCFAEQRPFDVRKYVWTVTVFLIMVFGVGGLLFGGVNTFFVFAWIFHQRHLASPEFDVINFLSYPYYIFRLEHWTFGLMFFGSVFLFRRKRLRELMPFVLVIANMAAFSLPEEKGVRYMCVMYPFMVMSAAYVIDRVFGLLTTRPRRFFWGSFIVVMTWLLMIQSYHLAQGTSSYDDSTAFLLTQNPDVKFLSSQEEIHRVFVPDPEQVKIVPPSLAGLFRDHADGYDYLIIEPQAYLALTQTKRRFEPELVGHYEYFRRHIQPVRVFDHFDRYMLERFVLENSSNLVRSTEFLRLAESRGLGKLYIYDLTQAVPGMIGILRRARGL